MGFSPEWWLAILGLGSAVIGLGSFIFFLGSTWRGIENQRHATARIFERVEDIERTLSEHDEVMIAHQWIRRTMSGIKIRRDE